LGRPLPLLAQNVFKKPPTSRTRLSTHIFRGLRRRGWSGQIASLTHETFFAFFVTATGRTFGRTPTLNTLLCVVPAKVVPCGVRNLTPPFTPKNVKIGNLRWQSMENCNCRNSGTVSRIQLKLSTGIEHPSGIM